MIKINLVGLYKKNAGNSFCFEKKLYWLESDDKEYKLSLEKKFNDKFEKEFKSIIQKANDCVISLTDDERVYLLNFVIALKLRTPNIVKSQKNINSENYVKAEWIKQGCSFQDYYIAKEILGVKEEIANMGLNAIADFTDTKAYEQFIYEKFGKGYIYILDTTECQYQLITSNYPVIDAKNLISKEGYDVICPLAPNVLFLLASKKSLCAFKNKEISDWVIRSNIGILNNHKNRSLEIDYEIYSNTKIHKQILPEGKINDYFE